MVVETAIPELTRPVQSYGTRGTAAQVSTNHYRITSVPNDIVHMYTIVTEGLKPRERKQKTDAVIKTLLDNGKQIYASGNMILSFDENLVGDEGKVDVVLGQRFDKEKQVKVDHVETMEVKFRVKRKLSDLMEYCTNSKSKLASSEVNELLQVCDIMTRFDPTFNKVLKGQGQFTPSLRDTRFFIRGTNLEMLKGLQTHTKMSSKHGLLLNVDLKYKTLFQELNLAKFFENSSNEERKMLKGVTLIIDSKTTKRKSARFVCLSDKTARTYMIKVGEDSQEMSVMEYFAERGVVLSKPDMKLVCTNKARETFYPPELLKIAPDQVFEACVPDINSIRNETCLKPADRKSRIQSLFTRKEHAICPSSQIEVESEMMQVPARFLPAPNAIFLNREERKPNRQNQVDTRNARFNAPCQIKSFAVVNFSRLPYSEFDSNFIRNLRSTMNSHGTLLPQGKYPYLEQLVDGNGQYREYDSVKRILENAYHEAENAFHSPPDVIFCITPSFRCGVYHHCKFLTEATQMFNRVVMTQFMQADKFKANRGRPAVNAQYCSNIWLKLNEKLSYQYGQNYNAWRLGSAALSIIKVPTMLIGIDVCHGNEIDARSSDKSVASFVASMDGRFTDYRNYNCNVIGENTSAALSKGLTELMGHFKTQNGMYPQNIIVYRDGLSEGQFDTFGSQEIQALLSVGKDLAAEIKLVFVSCIKRHSVRFFSQDQRITSRNGNLNNGLVVDKEITGKHFEFFLQAHNGLQGVAIPVKYVVLRDDMQLSADDLQQFTFNLCYNFQRSAAPTSIPNVVKMADLYAARIFHYNSVADKQEMEKNEQKELVKRSYYL